MLIRSEMQALSRASPGDTRDAYKCMIKPLRTTTQLFEDVETFRQSFLKSVKSVGRLLMLGTANRVQMWILV
jgi:hypothetical protein